MIPQLDYSVKRGARWGQRVGAMWSVALVLIGMKCGNSIEACDRIVANARQCTAQEQCSIAGGVKGCRCPVAVRADAQGRVDAAAQEVTCALPERLYCPPLRNPRCDKQTCVADGVYE